jgi:hypothetical protein
MDQKKRGRFLLATTKTSANEVRERSRPALAMAK